MDLLASDLAICAETAASEVQEQNDIEDNIEQQSNQESEDENEDSTLSESESNEEYYDKNVKLSQLHPEEHER